MFAVFVSGSGFDGFYSILAGGGFYRFFNLNTMVMNLVLAIIPVLLLIILMAFFKMSGDKSSVISLVVTMLIAFFGFHFPVNDLLSSFLFQFSKNL